MENFSSLSSPTGTVKGHSVQEIDVAKSKMASRKTLLHQVSLEMPETIAENEQECIENKHAEFVAEEKFIWQDLHAFMTPIQIPDTIFKNGDLDFVEEIFSVIEKPATKTAVLST